MTVEGHKFPVTKPEKFSQSENEIPPQIWTKKISSLGHYCVLMSIFYYPGADLKTDFDTKQNRVAENN